jgi:predicted metalloendopeptidase
MINNDFYTYINKKWLLNNPIPKDKSRWSQFDIINEKNLLRLKYILEHKIPANDKLYILYKQSLENYDNINLCKQILDNIEKIDNIELLFELFIDFILIFDIDSPINFYVFSDFNNSEKNILHIKTGGLGLPSKEYYFKDSQENIRKEYIKFINEYSKLFNLNLDHNKIFLFEKMLAEKSYNSQEERDINFINNKRNFNELIHDYPKLRNFFEIFFKKINKNILPNELININNPRFLKKINELYINELLDIWKDYFKFKYILSINYFTNNNVYITYNNFYKKKLFGNLENELKWKDSINTINNLLGQELGKYYTDLYFDENDMCNMKIIISYIIKVVNISLSNNSWLTSTTKNKALLKVNKINIKIGKPNNKGLYDFSNLIINGNYFNNIIDCIKYNKLLNYNNLYTNINKHRWYMNPQITNAYYSPSFNEIVFPAGILQEPFYYKDDIIKSFGGIGFVIGHEIIHAFDNKGRLFNEDGNLQNWWNSNDLKIYNKLNDKLIEQYNKYKFYNENINGKLTLGENIADLGGLKFSLLGMTLYLKKLKIKLRYSYYKNFFINYANILACNIREEKFKYLLLTDPHSPSILRVNAILKNFEIFLKVFNIVDGDMYLPKKDQIIIW